VLDLPKGTMIFVKDLRPKIHKKLKPIYFKIPQQVVTEYSGVVYAKDIFGKIHRHSKNNLKKASDRSLELFGMLPDDIKLILGEEFNAEIWEKIKDDQIVPEYLADIELDQEMQMITRQKSAEDTHVLEQDGPGPTNTQGDLDDAALLADLEETELLDQLKTLHDENALTDPGITIADVPRIFSRSRNVLKPNLLMDAPVPSEDVYTANDIEKVREIDENICDINEKNILPEGTKRHVRFHLPKS
jgi:hypothetical protein